MNTVLEARNKAQQEKDAGRIPSRRGRLHLTPSENRVSWFRAGVAKNGVQRARLGETRATPLIYNAATISVVLVCVLI